MTTIAEAGLAWAAPCAAHLYLSWRGLTMRVASHEVRFRVGRIDSELVQYFLEGAAGVSKRASPTSCDPCCSISATRSPATSRSPSRPQLWQYVRALVRAGLLERIPSPLTLSGDLGKRRSAQRLALDT